MKIWANYGVLRCGVGTPRNSIGPRQGVACPRRGVIEMEDLASLGYAEAKGYAAVLFRGLVCWTNKNPISV